MLTLFLGEDGSATKEALNIELFRVQQEHPNALVIRADSPEDIAAALEASSQSALFGDPAIIVLDELFTHKDGERVVAAIEEFAGSASHIFAFERKVKKEIREKVLKAKGIIREIAPRVVAKQKEDERPFALTDAIVRKDKKGAWKELLRLLRSGMAPEMLHGTIFWAVKLMLLAKDEPATDAAKLGFSPGAFRSYQGHARRWTREELVDMIERLVDMQHDAHQGGAPLSVQLERFILGLKV
jgi:DNA polymerase III delta subunit